MDEDKIDKAVAQGRKNQRTARLVENWCRNARIVRPGGVGLIEEIYKVPIGHMGIECDHAPVGGMQSWNLEEATVDFYLRNCKGCDKREPGSGPDITPLIQAYKNTMAVLTKKEAEHKEREAEKRTELKLELDKLRAPAGPDTNQIIDLIEAIEKDENGNPIGKLPGLALLAPETFSEEIIEFLKKQVLEGKGKLASPALNTLLALPVDSETKRKLAISDASGYGVHKSSVKYLEEAAKELSSEDVKAILPSFTLEAFPFVGLIQPRHQPNATPLLTLASHHGEIIKQTLHDWLGSGEEQLVEIAVRVICVITSKHPALVKPFLRDVFGKLLRHKILLPGFSNEALGENGLSVLRSAAARLFCAFPDDSAPILQLLLEGSNETARSEGARLYASVLNKKKGGTTIALGKAQEIAFERVLWMAVDISDNTLNDEAMQSFSYVHEELLPIAVTHLDSIIGAAATLSSKMESVGKTGIIETPKTGFEEIQRSQNRSLICRFQGNLVKWAFKASALKDTDGVEEILSFYAKLPESQVEMRSNMVAHFSVLMGKPEHVNLVLPHLYTAMTSPEPLVRGAAAEAIGNAPYELRRDFPELLFEIYLMFLTDLNICVHKPAVHALKIHAFPENLKQQLANCLIKLIWAYSTVGTDEHFLIECMEHYAHGCLTDTQLSGKEGLLLVRIIGQLNDMYACQAVEHLGNSLKNTPEFVNLCAKCLQGNWADQINGNHGIFYLLLGHVQRNRLREAATDLVDTAKSFPDNRLHLAGQIVVLLAKAGCWTEALSVCQHMLSVIPDTRLNLSIRLYFESLRQICAFESARPKENISIAEADEKWSTLLEDMQKEEADRIARDFFSQHFHPDAVREEENPFQLSFSHRLSALKTIEQGDEEAIQTEAIRIKDISEKFGRLHPSTELSAFSETLDCLAFAQRWTKAVRNADADSERFRKAFQLRAKEALEKRRCNEPAILDSVLSDLAEIEDPSALTDLKLRVLQTPLPFGVWVDEHRTGIPVLNTEIDMPEHIEIAFVKFEIDGQPAKEIDTLRPNTIHDIKIDIRVSRWPDSADQLVVTPVSMEPSDTYDLPTFVIDQPIEEHKNIPYIFKKSGRLLLKMPTAINANPLEFKYRVVFEPSCSERPPEIFGHRTLRIESHDLSAHTFSGYAEIDSKLLELRNELRMFHGLPHEDVAHALEVCAGLGNLAGQALSDNLFLEGTKEKEFQTEVVKVLRSRPNIGEDLERHPQTGGGIADLSFHRIRIELKAVSGGEIDEAEINKFVDQAAQYVISSGKRVGVLCLLDSRKKTAPPQPVASHLRIIRKDISDTCVLPIIFLCVKGGLARPSDLSR